MQLLRIYTTNEIKCWNYLRTGRLNCDATVKLFSEPRISAGSIHGYMTTKRTKSRLAGELSHFVHQYVRKAQASEPNDRQYDRKLEEKMGKLLGACVGVQMALLFESVGESTGPGQRRWPGCPSRRARGGASICCSAVAPTICGRPSGQRHLAVRWRKA